MSDLPKLLPCPWCGESPDPASPHTFQDSQGTKWGSVVCCCVGPEVRTGYQDVEHWRDDAAQSWNERVADPRVAELERRLANFQRGCHHVSISAETGRCLLCDAQVYRMADEPVGSDG